MQLPNPDRRRIPIKLGARRTGQGSEFVDCPPIIEVHVSCERDWNLSCGRPPKHDGTRYAALVDSGAERTAISSVVASQIGLSLSANAVVHGLSGTQTFGAGDIHVFIPDQNIAFSERAAVCDLQTAGHMFSIVLGRSFLEHCRLEVDGRAGTYSLLWLG